MRSTFISVIYPIVLAASVLAPGLCIHTKRRYLFKYTGYVMPLAMGSMLLSSNLYQASTHGLDQVLVTLTTLPNIILVVFLLVIFVLLIPYEQHSIRVINIAPESLGGTIEEVLRTSDIAIHPRKDFIHPTIPLKLHLTDDRGTIIIDSSLLGVTRIQFNIKDKDLRRKVMGDATKALQTAPIHINRKAASTSLSLGLLVCIAVIVIWLA